MKGRACELCGGAAALHCAADAADLCWRCDARVHGANFLVARHVRRTACDACEAVSGRRFSGPGSSAAPLSRPLCASCRDLAAPSSSASSSSVSSASSSAAPNARPAAAARAEEVLALWGRKMGLVNWRRCAEMAGHVLGSCGRATSALPLRVGLAAALWHAAKASGEDKTRQRRRSTWDAPLGRLEACSHVPARVIAAAAERLARAALPATDHEEGWAECS